VLLVEDDPFARRLALSVLRDIGIGRIAVANDGHGALQTLFGGDTFDLVISDWNMPEMSGLNLLKKVRETWPALPFIMLTGNTTGDSVLTARDSGVNAYVVKPFAKRQLAAKIAAVLNLKAV